MYSLGKMGVAWNEFTKEVQNVIHKQLEARFRDMIPQRNLFMTLLYLYIVEIYKCFLYNRGIKFLTWLS